MYGRTLCKYYVYMYIAALGTYMYAIETQTMLPDLSTSFY